MKSRICGNNRGCNDSNRVISRDLYPGDISEEENGHLTFTLSDATSEATKRVVDCMASKATTTVVVFRDLIDRYF